jgi:hypothetical protein
MTSHGVTKKLELPLRTQDCRAAVRGNGRRFSSPPGRQAAKFPRPVVNSMLNAEIEGPTNLSQALGQAMGLCLDWHRNF